MTFPSGTPLPLKLSIMYITKIDNSKIVQINAIIIKLIVLKFYISFPYRYRFLQQKDDMLTHSLDLRKGYKDRPNRNPREYKSRKFLTRISQTIVLYPYQTVFNL